MKPTLPVLPHVITVDVSWDDDWKIHDWCRNIWGPMNIHVWLHRVSNETTKGAKLRSTYLFARDEDAALFELTWC